MSHLHRGRFIKLQRLRRAAGAAVALAEVIEKVATPLPAEPHVGIGAPAPSRAKPKAKKKAKAKKRAKK